MSKRKRPWWYRHVDQVLEWFCHDNGPAPEIWRKADPWKSILEVLDDIESGAV